MRIEREDVRSETICFPKQHVSKLLPPRKFFRLAKHLWIHIQAFDVSDYKQECR